MTDPATTLPDSRWVNVIKPSGDVVSVPRYALQQALSQGYTIETPDMRRSRLLEEKFGGDDLKAALSGALRGATFGVSDQLLTKLGLVEPTTLAGLREANPVASTAAEVVGAVAPAILTKRAPTAMVSRLTGAIAPAVSARLGGGVAARILGTAAAQAAEGGAYGAGMLVSDQALGKADLTAENVLAYVGLGAAAGGAVGGLGGAGVEAAKAGAQLAAAGVKKATHKTADFVGRLYQATTGEAPADGMTKAWRTISNAIAKGHGVVGDGDPAVIAAGLNTKAGRAALSGFSDDEKMALAREATEIIDEVHRASQSAMPLATGEMKREMVASSVKTGNEGAMVAENKAVLDKIRSALLYAKGDKTLYKESGKAIDDGLARMDKYYETVVGLRRTEAQPERIVNRGKGVTEVIPAQPEGWSVVPGWHADNTTAFMELDKLKRMFGQPQFSQAGKFWPTGLKGPAAQRYRSSYDEILMPHLENPDLWGKAALAQREVNDKWVGWFPLEHEFQSAFMSRSLDPARQLERGWATSAFDADVSKFSTFLNLVGTGRGNSAHQRGLLAAQLRNKLELAESVMRHYDVPPEVVASVRAAQAKYSKLEPLLKQIDKKVAGANQLKQMSGADAGGLGVTALGYAAAGAPGALFAQAVSRPDRAIKVLAAIDRMAAKVKGKITPAIDEYIERGSRAAAAGGAAARRGIEKLRPAAGVATGAAGRSAGSRREDFNAKMDQILDEAKNPAKTIEQVSRATAGFADSAPRVAQAIIQKDVARRAYLYNELPKQKDPPSLFDKPGERKDPSDFLMDAWLQKYEIAFDPSRAIDHLVARSLTPAHVHSLKANFPDLYLEVQTELMQRVPGSNLPYQDRLGLGRLFDVNLDPTTRPEFVASMKPAPPPKQSHEKKLDANQEPLEERTATASTTIATA